jgi:hypothetical protein
LKYEHILQNLDRALAFCESIGLGNIAEKSRFAHYRRQIAYLLEVIEVRPIPRELAEHQHEYRTALTESIEFGYLLPYLQQCDPIRVSPKIQACLSGPIMPSDESSTSNRARNLQFELYLASTLWQAGFQPILGEHPDLKCEVDGKWFFFECKRLLSATKLKTRIHEAGKQLRKNRSSAPHGARGIVAVSLFLVLNPTQRALPSQDEHHGREILANWLESQGESVQDELAKLSHQKISAILFHAASPFENFDPSRYALGQYFVCDSLARAGSVDYNAVLKLADAMEAVAARY